MYQLYIVRLEVLLFTWYNFLKPLQSGISQDHPENVLIMLAGRTSLARHIPGFMPCAKLRG